MESSSTLKPISIFTPVLEPDDLDAATSRLIVQLLLQDIAEINARRKGKARVDAPLSDEELAFRMQREFWENTVRTVNDYAMAKSLNDAIDTDYRFLRALSIQEQAAEDDRRAALALSNGRQLPPQSDAQRLVENPSFSDLSEPASEEFTFNSSSKAAQKRVVDGAVTRSSIVYVSRLAFYLLFYDLLTGLAL
ncbi:hypothetical protein C0995_014470 [Termitomyces sp. Mi166|nr:hypothetical protein C0995_014470 [Termitomyces sp. Mi166\